MLFKVTMDVTDTIKDRKLKVKTLFNIKKLKF